MDLLQPVCTCGDSTSRWELTETATAVDTAAARRVKKTRQSFIQAFYL